MRYLIDGHNLIAQIPDIDIADPEDEVKLIYKLRSFAARIGKNISMTVVFDGGIPGGVERNLSTSKITARFAAAEKSNADNVLRSLIQKVTDPAACTLVSSDRELIDLAQEKKIPVINAQEFINQLNRPAKKRPPSEARKYNPNLSKNEVEAWLEEFDKKKS